MIARLRATWNTLTAPAVEIPPANLNDWAARYEARDRLRRTVQAAAESHGDAWWTLKGHETLEALSYTGGNWWGHQFEADRVDLSDPDIRDYMDSVLNLWSGMVASGMLSGVDVWTTPEAALSFQELEPREGVRILILTPHEED